MCNSLKATSDLAPLIVEINSVEFCEYDANDNTPNLHRNKPFLFMQKWHWLNFYTHSAALFPYINTWLVNKTGFCFEIQHGKIILFSEFAPIVFAEVQTLNLKWKNYSDALTKVDL